MRLAGRPTARVPADVLNGAHRRRRIGVRPEKVRVLPQSDPPEPDANRLAGTVRDVSYIGVSTQYVIDTPDRRGAGRDRPERGRGARHLSSGEAVQVLWDPRAHVRDHRRRPRHHRRGASMNTGGHPTRPPSRLPAARSPAATCCAGPASPAACSPAPACWPPAAAAARARDRPPEAAPAAAPRRHHATDSRPAGRSPTGRSTSTRRTRPSIPRSTSSTRSSPPRTNYLEDIEDNESFFGKVKAQLEAGQNIKRDIVVLTDWMAGKWVLLGLREPSSTSRAAAQREANQLPAWQGRPIDPDDEYLVPWQSGMTGIAYNPKLTGGELTSVNDLWNPEFKGKVTLLTEMRDTLGLVMLSMGIDPAKCTVDDAQTAVDEHPAARRERPGPPLHRQRLRRRPGQGQRRRLHGLVGRHRPAAVRQPRPQVPDPRRAARCCGPTT